MFQPLAFIEGIPPFYSATPWQNSARIWLQNAKVNPAINSAILAE
jgi:hypothetical protein